MLSKKFIGKCNLLNSTICQELFNMGIIWNFQMTHCIIKNMYANKLFEIGIIYYYFICYVFFGSSAQLHLMHSLAWDDPEDKKDLHNAIRASTPG